MVWFGSRATSAMIGLGFLAAFTGILAGGSNGPAAQRYAVTAPLLFLKSGPVYACLTFDLMGGCGGVTVKGASLGNLPVDGQMTVASVGITTTPVRLVGTWDGTALTLTQPPAPGAFSADTPQACVQPVGFEQPTGGMPPLMQRLIDDESSIRSRHIQLLEFHMCDETTLGIFVAVADEPTVSWLTTRYRNVKIAGWLQPVPTGW